MKQRDLPILERLVEDEILVNVTLAGVPSALLAEFLEKIVLPHYSGSLSHAAKDLMQRAIEEEDFVSLHAKNKH